MKISELFEKEDKKPDGTYAAARLSADTKKKIAKYLKDNDIQEPLDPDEMHCTILYSRKYLPDYKAAGKYDKPIVGTKPKFEIWPNRDKTANVLVLTISCPGLTARHKELMDEHDATYDFDDYKPHVSFSYNFGDSAVDSLAPIDFPIEFDTEYQEDLDSD